MERIYKEFAIQIVLQAVKDYKHVLKFPTLHQNDYSRGELETFFKSKWCSTLTEVDMVEAMEHMKKEAGVI